MFISVANVKGGVGRSTISQNLAAELQRTNTITLVDADLPQGTSEAWYYKREEMGRTGGMDIATAYDARQLRKVLSNTKTDITIIDAPPREIEMLRVCISLADLILIPITANTSDIWAAQDFIDTVEGMKPEAEVRLVWNKHSEHIPTYAKLRQEVEDLIEAEFLTTTLGHRTAFFKAMLEGLGAAEANQDAKATAEVENLIKEIKEVLYV